MSEPTTAKAREKPARKADIFVALNLSMDGLKTTEDQAYCDPRAAASPP
jgi:hypothetical protein